MCWNILTPYATKTKHLYIEQNILTITTKQNEIIKMNKAEFLELRDSLQQFEEEHSLELITNKETQALNLMISVMTDYINHFPEGN